MTWERTTTSRCYDSTERKTCKGEFMKLYEIDQAIQAILDGAEVDAETGELLLNTEELEALQMAREEKLEGVALAIKNLSAEAAAIREEEKKLAERRKVTENKVERLKAWLAYVLDGGKLETARVRVSCTKPTKSTVIDDIEEVSSWYESMALKLGGSKEYWTIRDTLDYRLTPSVSKAGLKKLLATYDIPGVHLEDGKPGLRIV